VSFLCENCREEFGPRGLIPHRRSPESLVPPPPPLPTGRLPPGQASTIHRAPSWLPPDLAQSPRPLTSPGASKKLRPLVATLRPGGRLRGPQPSGPWPSVSECHQGEGSCFAMSRVCGFRNAWRAGRADNSRLGGKPEAASQCHGLLQNGSGDKALLLLLEEEEKEKWHHFGAALGLEDA